MGTKLLLIALSFCALYVTCDGCQMENVNNWFFIQQVEILDTHDDIIVERSTSNILGITNVVFSEGLNNGPYMDVHMSDSTFIIMPNENFTRYEEYETTNTTTISITFSCVGGSTNALTFVVTVRDTNNNDPVFQPDDDADVYEFSLMPPLPPGYKITNFFPLIVRDIDLTTQRIDFEIYDTSLFEIAYDAESSTTPKEFRSSLTTTTFIRNIPEPIEFTIRATDVDLTGNPQRSRKAVVRIQSDGNFELPEELLFTQTFYMADYTNDQIVLREPISLQQGYHEEVNFSLGTGEHSNYFDVAPSGNDVQIRIVEPIPVEILQLRKLFLVVRAERQYTSGTSATVILQLPEEVRLQFENPIYVGTIVDNYLQLPILVLSQGYEYQTVSVEIQSDYASNFGYNIDENRITINMSRLEESIIQQNSFLNLKVIASTSISSASTVVTLEVIKDDTLTPVFQRALYTGTYDVNEGLVIEDIILVQGLDSTVSLSLSGDHKDYFQLDPTGPNIKLTATSIPPELFPQGQLLLTITASKPRTVGANAAISINLPAARELRFSQEFYKGTLQDNILNHGPITLNSGYSNDVDYTLSDGYEKYFRIIRAHNQVTLELLEHPETENDFVLFSLLASAPHALSTTTTILLEIIKEDTSTPVFSEKIYTVSYSSPTNVDIPRIFLSQGFDNTASFRIAGEHSEYFAIEPTGNNVHLSVKSTIPEELIFNEKVLIFNVIAEKPLTVGARAAISVIFPAALTEPTPLAFSKTIYTGSLEDNDLNIEEIKLNVGFTTDVQFTLNDEFKDYFQVNNDNSNIVIISLHNTLPTEILTTKFIALELTAQRERAVPVTATVLIDIVQPEPVVPPVFSGAFYRATYTEAIGLQFEKQIYLSEGFDDTVTFDVEGDDSVWFKVTNNNYVVTITTEGIHQSIMESNNHLVFTIIARKPDAIDGRATIVVDLPKEETPEVVVLRFSQPSYIGTIEEETLKLPFVTLTGVYDMAITLIPTGEYASYFKFTRESNVINIELSNDFPSEMTTSLITIDLEASYPDAISGFTTLVIELVEKPEIHIITPVFEQAYYVGQYTEQDALSFEKSIQLIQGFDETVSFSLAGEDADYFELDLKGENSYGLKVTDQITQINDRANLIFSVIAAKPGSVNGEAAIVIKLSDVSNDQVLGFERINYVGTLDGETMNLPPIVLSEGFTPDVQFKLQGDLADFFTAQPSLNTVTVTLIRTIPEDILLSSRVIVLQLEATASQRLPAYTTLILEVKVDEVDPPPTIDLVFTETYYVGSYSAADGLAFDAIISLAEGYDASVTFDLEGDNAQWFRLDGTENNAILALENTIPPAVLANNQQLIFVVRADRPGSATTRATIVVLLTDDVSNDQVLGFERINYVGTLDGETMNLPPIVLSEGFTPDVQFTLQGDLADFFTAQPSLNTVTVTLIRTIPEDILLSSRVIVLQLEATASQRLPAYTTLILEVKVDEVDPPPTIDLVFTETYYVGSYSAADGLAFDAIISLAEGYDASVTFDLEGDNAQWFRLDGTENNAILTLENTIPPAVLANNQQLIFVVRADRPGSATTRATVVVLLTDDVSNDQILGFERINYVGTLDGETMNLPPIVLSEGFTPDVQFTLQGDLADFFTAQPSLNTVTVTLIRTIPENILLSSRVIVLQLGSTASQRLPAYTTLILEVKVDEVDPPPTIDLVFTETYYVGSYSAADGLAFDAIISLAEGYDASVTFDLEGDNAQWFRLDGTENNAILTLENTIPPAVLANNQQLIFVVRADRPGSATTRATIVVLLTDDVSNDQILGFERINYVGTLDGETMNLPPIVLSEGFTPDVQFTLQGDLADFFTAQPSLNTVTVTLIRTIPEDILLSSRVIVLQLEATASQRLPAYTTLILEVKVDEVDPPPTIDLVFTETYYVGSYSAADGLAFDAIISLAEGYDASVTFDLEGDNAQWFRLDGTENNAILALENTIPPAVLANNQQLIFVVRADRPGSATTRATIVVLLTDDVSNDQVLGFERINYVGTLDGETMNLPPIVLSEGFTPDVQFTLQGDLADFFTAQPSLNTVTVTLIRTIPEDILLSSRVIVLQLEATASQRLPAYTTLILEVKVDEVDPPPTIDLVFTETYYVGSYSAADGLAFDAIISLAEGYDASVTFDLEGDNAQWFRLDGTENNAILALENTIPPAVLANNQQLIFVVRADRPGSATTRATIVVLLTDDVSNDQVLGFERINYVGTLDGETMNLPPIVLSEGFTPDVQFTLQGDLADFFTAQPSLNTVTVTLIRTIPEDILLSSRVIVLQLEATASQRLPAYTTLILEVKVDEVDPPPTIDLVFTETYYVGSYSAADGLAFDAIISLAEGYDASVTFDLEGDNAQWFRLDGTENNAILALENTIPPAVLANNQQLIFVVRADRPGSATTRATIVVLLTDDVSNDQVLGFERINYVGTLDGETMNLPPIVLSEGFTPDVQFTLQGDLADFFTAQPSLNTVTVTLIRTIPEDILLSSRVIVLQLEATASQRLPAYTTLILEVKVDEVDPPPTIDLVFTETYYVGSYSAADGLAFDAIISLAEGYDASVTFDLEGDNAQWFRLDGTENNAILALENTIPPAVLANNQQLIFVVRADRPGSATTRATIVVLLTDDVSNGQVLGFERINYVGTLDGETMNLPPIVLSEGFTPDVQFTLQGDLADFFTAQPSLNTVTVTLIRTIPEDILLSSRVIVLQLEATASQRLPAYTTLILEVKVDEVDPPPTIDLVFTETYYVGSYSAADCLAFDAIISLAEGYDASVTFDLEGDNAQWFRLDGTENNAILTLENTIPPAVLANNQQLIFVVRADRPGSATTRATVVVLLTDDVSNDQVLGFERINYVGTLDGETMNLPPIVLSEGFTPDVQFTLQGDLADFFTAQSSLNTVTVTLIRTIPEDILLSSRVIVLQLEATASQRLPAYTTLILEVKVDEVDPPPTIDLVFTETYYVGSYSAADGLAFDAIISLAEGYDASVTFDLEGDNAQWFRLDGTENNAILALENTIPPAVLANNQQLIFVVRADRPGSATTRATVVVLLTDDVSNDQVLGFERINYVGTLDGETMNLPPIVLSEGFTPDVQFTLQGDLADFFTAQPSLNTVTVTLIRTIPEDILLSSRVIVLQLEATASQRLPAYTTLILEVKVDEVDPPPTIDLVFTETYYVGSYSAADGLAFDAMISLAEGYDASVTFDLEGDNAQWFRLDGTENNAILTLENTIPPAVLANNQQLIFVVRADRPGSATTRATVVVLLTDDVSNDQVLGFERINYVGTLDGETMNLPPIVLSEGFTPDVQFTLQGDLADFFTAQPSLNTVTVTLIRTIPEDILLSSRVIVLQLEATASQHLPAYTTLILEVKVDEVDPPPTIDLVFTETYYVGSYSAADSLAFDAIISLAEGYDASVTFDLEGDNAQWFRLDGTENNAILALENTIPPAVLANNQQLIFVVRADRPGSATTRATIVVLLTDDVSNDQVLGFERINYVGTLDGETMNLPPIVLSEGFTPGVQFTLQGDLADFFTAQPSLNTVTVTLIRTIPEDILLSSRVIVLQLEATASQHLPAYTTLILEVKVDEVDPPPTIDLVFTETYYVGSYSVADGLAFDAIISLAEGYDASVTFDLEGDNAQWFRLDGTENNAILTLENTIPPAVLANNQQLIFLVRADRPGSATTRATIVLLLTDDGEQGNAVAFGKVLYEGRIQGDVVQHEIITITDFEKDEIDIIGSFAAFFTARHNDGLVLVEFTGSLPFPANIQHIALQLRAENAAAVLVFEISGTEPPVLPNVAFSSPSYVVRVEMGQTGTVGRVEATADNGEMVTYSLDLDNEHLQSRLSITSEGELRLSASANTGVYMFQAIARTVFSGVTGSATIYFSVEAIAVCGDDIVTAPLIVINRDEEEEHRNLVVIDPSKHEDCQYSLTNKWPADQDWLYVDETGLHARVIDREDPSIAFMALSQVQVELTLNCQTETRSKRSITPINDWLGPYDYGTNTWLLGKTIEYNSKKTIVNLIVNDINDNPPKFAEEEITVGYPVTDLIASILPRSLIELKATDADVGENAALVYWSSEPQLAVSPTTGFVHVSNDAELTNDMQLQVNATDLNGQGLTGTILLTVKLLDASNIGVLSVQNAFLEDEVLILRNLSNALEYEIKSLRSAVTPNSDSNEESTTDNTKNRKKREVADATGATLEIHVYGLIEREPVAVERLLTDVTENAAVATYTVSSIITLDEHLAGICNVSEQKIGFFVATIVLSAILFLIIVAAVILFIYLRKKSLIYKRFSDTNSLASRVESPVTESKPDGGSSLPRLNFEELKRSEKRLQDMLTAPIPEVVVEPTTSANNAAIIPVADTKVPIIIQDKLKDIDESDEDEFGERKKDRRKSVVTFNENVEKIIHVEDNPTDSEYEVYKL